MSEPITAKAEFLEVSSWPSIMASPGIRIKSLDIGLSIIRLNYIKFCMQKSSDFQQENGSAAKPKNNNPSPYSRDKQEYQKTQT